MSSKTKTILFLVITNFIITKCEEKTITIDNTDLLRGSGVKREEELILPEATDALETEENTTKYIEENTTTEVVSTSTIIPEPLSLKIPDDKVLETNDDLDVDKHDEVAVNMTENESTETSVGDGFKKESTDVPNVNNNSIEYLTESSTASTRAMDELDSIDPGPGIILAEGLESTGMRSAKTDNYSKPEKRNFEPPPLPPAATKSSTLRGWLEDTWLRQPAGLLVPLRPMALSRALAVWNDLTIERLNVSDIVIIGYDSNGINWRSRHNLLPSSTGEEDRTVAEALSKLLLKYQGTNTDTTDGTMRALASAAKLVPYDSALFVVTDRGAGDGTKLPLALRALVEKRLKVYVVWTDPNYPSEESEAQLQELRDISDHTEGDVLPYSLHVMDTDGSGSMVGHGWESMMPSARQGRLNAMVEPSKWDTLLVRRGGGEALSLGVPVENGVLALRIYIEGLVEHAVLYPPNDSPQIDLYNQTSVRAFSPVSRTEKLTPRDVHLVFPGATFDFDTLLVTPMSTSTTETSAPTVGLWHLSVRCDKCDYRLCVSAYTRIHFYATIDNKDTLKIRVLGPVASIRESQLIDEYGTELAKLSFSYQPIAGEVSPAQPVGPPAELIADVPMPSVKGSKIYAKIVGRDIRGEPFVRLSGPLTRAEVRTGRSASITFPDSTNDLERAEADNSRVYNQRLQYNDSNVLPYNRAISQVVNQRGSLLTAVQIGLSTRLYGAPGDSLQLHFEVTNFREQAIRFNFGAVGELRFLRGINPTQQTIQSGQTANVIVSVGITSTAQAGARDLITFTAFGLEQVSISAYVYVTNSGNPGTDVWSPEVRHNFQGTCIGRLGSDCAQHTWSATVIARDAVGGLLRLSSSPIGLTYDSNFIAGSREEVVAIYRATCCAPRVVVTAVDAFGNANSYSIDISNYTKSTTSAKPASQL